MASPRGTAVVTGGSAGIGRAISRALADQGYDVAVLARGEERLRQTEEDLRERGVSALGIACDVSDAEAVDAAADRAEAELGPITVWVNNAMTTLVGRFTRMEVKDIERVIAVDLMGYVHGMKAALRLMEPRGDGVLINVGSGLALRAIPLQSAYCAAKAGVRSLTESVRAELIHDGSGVHLGLVHPPAVNTPQFEWAKTERDAHPQPLPPVYQPEVVAEAVLEAIDGRKREVLVGGAVAQLALGEAVAPGALDHILAEKGFSDQAADKPKTEDNEKGNLYAPSDLDYAARGTFSDGARDEALTVENGLARAGVLLLGAAALIGLGAVLGRR
jgi:short-subunit dehydrogenase